MNNQTITNEIWITIEEFPNYEVSNLGNVRNKKTKRVLKPGKNTGGYSFVNIKNKDGIYKKPKIHRLVAKAFIPNPENKPTVDHIIPISKGGTNEVSNLRWATRLEQEANKDKLSHRGCGVKRKNYCVELNKVFESTTDAAKEIGCNLKSIAHVLDGKMYTAKGYHFISYDKYLDMLTAELLEIAFPEVEVAPEVTICGQPLNDYLNNEAI